VLAGAFSSVHVRCCSTYTVDASSGAAVAVEWSHERLRVESIMSRDVFLSRTCLPIHMSSLYTLLLLLLLSWYAQYVKVSSYCISYLLLLCCCLDGNDVSAACPKTSDDYTRDTLAAAVDGQKMRPWFIIS